MCEGEAMRHLEIFVNSHRQCVCWTLKKNQTDRCIVVRIINVFIVFFFSPLSSTTHTPKNEHSHKIEHSHTRVTHQLRCANKEPKKQGQIGGSVIELHAIHVCSDSRRRQKAQLGESDRTLEAARFFHGRGQTC